MDYEKWVEYALEQIAMVRRLAAEIGGLNIHTGPDRELSKSTSSGLRFTLSEMKEAVSPEDIGTTVDIEGDVQPELNDDLSRIKSDIR